MRLGYATVRYEHDAEVPRYEVEQRWRLTLDGLVEHVLATDQGLSHGPSVLWHLEHTRKETKTKLEARMTERERQVLGRHELMASKGPWSGEGQIGEYRDIPCRLPAL